jgi:2-polyprenyl-3-methyl-5-hydroxy-6-metoxy-1,4-benzoquinol methylase
MVSPIHLRYQEKLFPGSSHFLALREFDDTQLDKESALLDIGAGSGVIGRQLRERGFQNVDGIEIDNEAITKISPHYRKVDKSISNLGGARYSGIFLLDVIEHLSDPLKMLVEASSLLLPNGRIFISVPNITHWSVRLKMLFGYFEYEDRGILDRTHLHFFTKRHLLAMCKEIPATKIIKYAGSVVPLQLLYPSISNYPLFASFTAFREKGVAIWPEAMAFQHFLVLTTT